MSLCQSQRELINLLKEVRKPFFYDEWHRNRHMEALLEEGFVTVDGRCVRPTLHLTDRGKRI